MRKLSKNNQVLSNIVSLSFLQAANYILPLVTMPYLIRVIGIDYFGLLSFATATVMYLYIMTEYGFNLTATKSISLCRGNKEKLDEIYSSVLTAKALLALGGFVLLCILVATVPKLASNSDVYIYTYGIVLGQVMFPVWVFQGLEKMVGVTIINVLSKTIFTVSVFVFIHAKEDYYLVPVLMSSGSIIAGLLSLAIVKKMFNIDFKIQELVKVMQQLRDGWHVFLSNIYTCVYTVSITFFLGIFANDTIVGIYSVSEKIARVAGNLFVPVNDALFPYISNKAYHDPRGAIKILGKLSIISLITMSLVSLSVFLLADWIILLVAGRPEEGAVTVLRLLAFLPLVLTLSRLFAHNYLINFDQKEELSRIYLYTSIASLILIFSLIPVYYEVGAAIAIMLVEIFAVVLMYRVIRGKILGKLSLGEV